MPMTKRGLVSWASTAFNFQRLGALQCERVVAMGEPLVNRGSDMFELEILLSRKEASSLAVWIDANRCLFRLILDP